jgi:transposase InsO family protein
MPWKEATKMSERRELITKWASGLYKVTELAEEFGVSRPTVYEWIRRYDEGGESALSDRRSVPSSCPHRTPEVIANEIVKAKREHPFWGPAKLINLLRLDHPEIAWPSASTAGAILDREGLVIHRPHRRSAVVLNAGVLKATESGEMMTADHKGQFRLGNSRYVFPVTINDPVSRFIYAIEGKTSTSYREARPAFERVFRQYGVPYFMGSDNGGPFSCSQALAGLSRLSVWWIKLGITPVRIHPGCPWENGVHERMHKTVKAETACPPAENERGQERRFDSFRLEFNTVRPHDGIGGRRPIELLKYCRRPYPRRLVAHEYAGHYETRLVRPTGEIRWKGGFIFLSQTLAGERVGMVELADGVWAVYFCHIELGRYDERTRRIA